MVIKLGLNRHRVLIFLLTSINSKSNPGSITRTTWYSKEFLPAMELRKASLIAQAPSIASSRPGFFHTGLVFIHPEWNTLSESFGGKQRQTYWVGLWKLAKVAGSILEQENVTQQRPHILFDLKYSQWHIFKHCLNFGSSTYKVVHGHSILFQHGFKLSLLELCFVSENYFPLFITPRDHTINGC